MSVSVCLCWCELVCAHLSWLETFALEFKFEFCQSTFERSRHSTDKHAHTNTHSNQGIVSGVKVEKSKWKLLAQLLQISWQMPILIIIIGGAIAEQSACHDIRDNA